MSTRALAEELVYRAALRLDALEFSGFLALCEPDFRYTAGAYSPEIRRPMLWLDQDREGMRVLFETLPRHNSDRAPLSRHVTVYTVEAGDGEGLLAVVSALQVFRTTLDGGATELYAVGKLHDTARLTPGGARLVRRHLELQTRMLGIGSHIPL
jgi:methanesulfonate monooxygenase small subunit